MNTYSDLLVWQKSMDLVQSVYVLTNALPNDEKFNLTSQIRRSAVSIPSNIAEGHDRKTNGEFGQFLRIAYGSSAELETQIILGKRLHMVTESDTESILAELVEVRKMLNKLIRTVANG